MAQTEGTQSTHRTGYGGDVTAYVIDVMIEAYRLNSLQVKDLIDDVKANNNEIRQLRELKAEFRKLNNAIKDNAVKNGKDPDKASIPAEDRFFKSEGSKFKYDNNKYFTPKKELNNHGGPSLLKDERISTVELDGVIDSIDDSIDDLANINQLELIGLQRGIGNLNLIISLTTNTIKSTEDKKEEIARNI